MPDLSVGLAPRRAAAAAWPRPAWPRALRAAGQVDGAVALGLAAVALGLDLFRLPGLSLWGDELFSVQLASRPWPVFWEFLSRYEPNMALYYVVLRGWLGLTSLLGIVPDELVVRVPSIFFAVLSVIVVFWIGRRFFGRTVGIVGALLYALNLIQLTAAREARSYGLEMFLLCLGWYAFLLIVTRDRPGPRVYLGYIVAMALAIYAHLFSTLVLASQVIAFAALLSLDGDSRVRLRRSAGAFARSVAAIGVAVIPMGAYFFRHGSTNAWLPPADATGLVRLLWNVAGHQVIYGVLLGVAVLAVVVLAIRARGHRAKAAHAWPRLGPLIALGAWVCVPVALSYAASQPRLNLHLFSWGYLIVVVPALCLLAGISIAAIRRPLARRAVATSLVAAAALATPILTSAPQQDFRTAARWVEERYLPGDGLVATSWSSSLAMDYYVRIDGAPNELLAASPAPWSWTAGGDQRLEQRAIAEYTVARHRIFLVDSPLEGDSPDVKARSWMARTWFDSRYALVSEIALPSALGQVRVRLYDVEELLD